MQNRNNLLIYLVTYKISGCVSRTVTITTIYHKEEDRISSEFLNHYTPVCIGGFGFSETLHPDFLLCLQPRVGNKRITKDDAGIRGLLVGTLLETKSFEGCSGWDIKVFSLIDGIDTWDMSG